MTLPLRDTQAHVILLDIEGTTTSIDFVYQVLFPYARARVKDFLQRHISDEDARADIASLRQEHAQDTGKGHNPPPLGDDSPEAETKSVVAYIHWLMDQDRKSRPLKSLQGKIWQDGYQTGELKGQVFDDVPSAFERWHNEGKQICIYSSGSVLAQKLLFAHTTEGDLTRCIHAYFDTNLGGKKDVESYRRIAASLEQPPPEIVFISDVTAELDAAQTAGLQTVLSLRPGNHPQPPSMHPVIHTFDEFFS